MRSRAGSALASLAFVLALPHAMACSIIPLNYERFDPREYVFYGEVVGYSALEKPTCGGQPRVCAPAWGLEVSVLRLVSAPEGAVSRAELYSFGLGADCSSIPMSEQQARATALGTRLKVVARTLGGHEAAPSGAARLHVSRWSDAVVAPIPAQADVAALYASAADYALWRQGGGGFDPDTQFELRKDLNRLREAGTQTAAKSVLSRLADFHWYPVRARPGSADTFERLVKEHLTDPKEIQEIEDRFSRPRCLLGILNRESMARLESRWSSLSDPVLIYCVAESLGKTDPKQAEGAYRRAAQEALRLEKRGDLWAPFVLAELYYRGLGGLPKDYDKATFLVCRNLRAKPPGFRRSHWWPRELETCA